MPGDAFGGGQEVMDIPLGPEIGQCCGGRTKLLFRQVTAELAGDIEMRLEAKAAVRPQVYIFGAGHVGQALAAALRCCPFGRRRRDTRGGAGDAAAGLANPAGRHAGSVVKEIAPGGAAVILTHDHALDFLIAPRHCCAPTSPMSA